MITRTFMQRFQALSQLETFHIAFGVTLLFICSQTIIPFKPVPISLAPTYILLLGLTYRPGLAFKTVGTYLILGAIGAPVFAGFSSGVPYMLGHTGGYLIGYLAAATTMALIQQRFKAQSFGFTLINTLLGNAILYACGMAWLAQFTGFAGAIQYGLLPFIIPGLIKAGLLAGALSILRHARNS